MAVAYVSVGTRGAASSGTSITPAFPASLAAGDLMVAIVSVANNATVSTPSGWNKIQQTNSGASWTAAVYWRIFQGGDTAVAYTWSGSVKNQAQVARFTGVDTTTPIGALGAVGTGTTSPHTTTGVTTTGDNSLILLWDVATAATAFSTPSGWAAGWGATGSVMALYGKTKAVSLANTASGNTSATGAAAAYVSQQIELRAAAVTVSAVPQAPFYAPRGFDDPVWLAGPLAAPLVAISTPIVTFFGAQGQAPTKMWRWDHVPQPDWVGVPDAAWPLMALTAQHMFGAGGQAPTILRRFENDSGASFWTGAPTGFPTASIPAASTQAKQPAWQPNVDNATAWTGAPDASAPLQILTAQKFFNAGGQVVAKLWRWDHDSGAGFWSGSPTRSQALAALTAGGNPNFRLWRWDHAPDPDWRAAPVPNWTLGPFIAQKMFGVGGQPATGPVWRVGADEPGWLPSPRRNIVALAVPTFPSLWRFIAAEPDSTPGWPVASDILRILTFGGAPAAKRDWRTYAEDGPWVGQASTSVPIRLLTVGGKPAFKAFWATFAEDGPWVVYSDATPATLVASLAPPSPRKNSMWRDIAEDAPPRLAAIANSVIRLLTEGGAPFKGALWRDFGDLPIPFASAIGVNRVLRIAAAQSPFAPTPPFALMVDADPIGWTLAPRRNFAVLAAGAAVFRQPAWRSLLDDVAPLDFWRASRALIEARPLFAGLVWRSSDEQPQPTTWLPRISGLLIARPLFVASMWREVAEDASGLLRASPNVAIRQPPPPPPPFGPPPWGREAFDTVFAPWIPSHNVLLLRRVTFQVLPVVGELVSYGAHGTAKWPAGIDEVGERSGSGTVQWPSGGSTVGLPNGASDADYDEETD